jgi:cell division protein FtsB
MRRGYDPAYGSREQLRDCHESGMKLRRENDALKEQIKELEAVIAYLKDGMKYQE